MKNVAKLTLFLAALAIPLMGSWCDEDPPAGGYVPHDTGVEAPDGGLLAGAPVADDPPEVAPLALDGGPYTTLSGVLDAHTVDASAPDADVGDVGHDPRVFFVSPLDGDEIDASSELVMGTEGFTLIPAHIPSAMNEGHLHVLVDVPCYTAGDAFPRGLTEIVDLLEAQTRVRVFLEPGTHTLCLQAGTSGHVALPLTHVITVHVSN